MDKEKMLHELALSYVLYTNLTDNPIDAESFYQDYNKATDIFDKLIKHYND